MEKNVKRVYVDNSVISGMFDNHLPERVKQTALFTLIFIGLTEARNPGKS